MTAARACALLSCVGVALGLAGTLEWDTVQADHDEYCAMVTVGAWPNYRGIRDTECQLPAPSLDDASESMPLPT